MPVSKRRKPKRHLAPHAMHPNEAKAHFRQLAQMDGKTFSLDGRLVLTGGTESPFANAWKHAQATGSEYAEGVVWRDETGWSAHAWCVQTLDGTEVVVEVSDGFEQATKYKGWVLDAEDIKTINLSGQAPTRSLLEGGLARGGNNYDAIVQRMSKRTARAAKDALTAT